MLASLAAWAGKQIAGFASQPAALITAIGCFAMVWAAVLFGPRWRLISGLLAIATLVAAVGAHYATRQRVAIENATNRSLPFELQTQDLLVRGTIRPGKVELIVHEWWEIRPRLAVIEKLPEDKPWDVLVSAVDYAEGWNIAYRRIDRAHSFTITAAADVEK